MKKWSILIVLVLAMAGGASAQFLGQMSPASILTSGAGKIGGYVVIHDHATAFVGSLRYGLSPDWEGRLRLGLIDFDGPNTDPHPILGGDVKYHLWKYKENNNPFDLSLCTGMEYASSNHFNFFGINGGVIGSMPLRLSNNTTIEPYSRLNLRYQHYSVDSDYGNGSASDLKVDLNLGAAFALTRYVDVTAEIQINDYFAFYMGVDFLTF
jgi:hypothetical protein